MIHDLLNLYGSYFENDKVVLDNYKLEDGVYILIDKNGDIKDTLEVNKNTQSDTELYDYFKDRDFYSQFVSSNKSIRTNVNEVEEIKKYYITDKKFTSNNYLTLFFKIDIIEKEVQILSEKKRTSIVPIPVFKEIVKEYYNSIRNFATAGKEEAKILEKIKTPEVLEERIDECEKIYIDNLDKILQKVLEMKLKDGTRVRLFLETDIEEYKKSSLKYIAVKIFKKNKYNVFKDEIYGMNSFNFGFNDEKPYLKLNTTTYKIPARLTYQQINKVRNAYIWILKNMNITETNIMPVDYTFDAKLDAANYKGDAVILINSVNDNCTARITNYEYIPQYTENIKKFVCSNYLNDIDIGDLAVEIKEIKKLKEIISENCFSLESNDETYKKKAKERYSDIFYNFFYKQNNMPLKQNINKIELELVKGAILNEISKKEFLKYRKFYKATKIMLIFLQLKEYLNLSENEGGTIMSNIEEIKKEAYNIINDEDKICNDDVFYFLVGQVAYYLIVKSKAENLTQDTLNPILKASTFEKMKKELTFLYNRYNHQLYVKNKKFNKVFSELLSYNLESKIKDNEQMILIGLLAQNIMYTKNAEKEYGGIENGRDEE